MKKSIEFRKNGTASVLLMLFFMMSFSSKVHAGIDTTLFRIHVLQDSVYAGDTVDVDFFIGNNSLLELNSLKQFEIEVISDTSLMVEDNIHFKLDSSSLASFFGTVFSNITTITNIDPVLGKINVKSNSPNNGSGNARVGRGQYIVQDNAAGRQQMRFDFSKAISKDLLGFNNPVKIITDSVLIINRVQVPTAIKTYKNNNIKISPNPVKDFINIKGEKIEGYKLLNINGNELIPQIKSLSTDIELDLSHFISGTYILMLQTGGEWSNHIIIKN